MNIKDKIVRNINRHILFSALFFLSIFKPISYQHITKYLGLGIGLVILILFFIVLLNKSKIFYIWNNFKIQISLITLLGFIYSVSTIINMQNYPTLLSFVFYGGSTLFVMSLLPISYILFSYSCIYKYQHPKYSIYNKYEHIGLATFILIHVLGIIIFIVGTKLEPIYSYTVAREVLADKTKSILNHHTTYGVISGLTIIFCVSLLLQRIRLGRTSYLAALTVLLALIGGILSSSRNFIWTLGIGLIFLAIQKIQNKKHTLLIIAIGITTFIIFNFIALQAPSIGKRFIHIFPYIQKWNQDKPISYMCRCNKNSNKIRARG